MGYIRVHDFTRDDFELSTISGSEDHPLRITVFLSEWEENFDFAERDRITALRFDPVFLDFEPVSVRFPAGKVFEFSGVDRYGVPFHYPFLKLTYLFRDAFNNINRPVDGNSFTFSFAIYYNGEMLEEWFMPVESTNTFKSLLFPLDRLIEAGKGKFDAFEINVLRHPGDMSVIYFGELFLFQDEASHNTLTYMQNLLEGKGSFFVTTLSAPAGKGSSEIIIQSDNDISIDSAIMIGDISGIHEVHNIISVTPVKGGFSVKIGNELDGGEIISDWPSGTSVYRYFPCITRPLNEGSNVFSVYYLSVGPSSPEPVRSYIAGYEAFAYIRDRAEGKHLAAVRKPTDAVRISVSINLYSYNRDDIEIMWREVRKIFDHMTLFYIAGTLTEYDFPAYSDNTENDGLFHYAVDFEFFIDENIHGYTYHAFPVYRILHAVIRSVTISGGSISEINGTPVIINF